MDNMATPTNIRPLGDNLLITMSDGSKYISHATGGNLWIVRGVSGPVDPGDPGTGDIYNPWLEWSVTGTWESHSTYSQGGIDRPLPLNTPILAPANGTLAAGTWTDAAGRRTEFTFDATFPRLHPASTTLMNGVSYEAAGPMVALVLQHQTSYGTPGHHLKGEIIGYSGDSAAPGEDPGDVHLHYHGLDAAAARLNFDNFV